MLELKKYSLTELKGALKISKRMWEERKEELLEYMNKFFDYEISYEGRYTYFNIKKQYDEYIPLPSKRDAQKISEYYYSETKKIVKEDPWNTGSNIARNIIARDENIYNHKEATIAGYVRPIIKEKFISYPQESSWRRLGENHLAYVELTQEQKEFLFELFEENSYEGQKKAEIEKFAEYKSGYITEAELKEYLFAVAGKSYGELMNTFKAKFGFTPMLIKKLEENAIKEEQDFEF